MPLSEFDFKRCSWNNNAVKYWTVSDAGVTQNTGAVSAGKYLVFTSTAIWFKRGVTGVAPAAQTGNYAPAGSMFWVEFTSAQGFLGAICPTGGSGFIVIMNPGDYS